MQTLKIVVTGPSPRARQSSFRLSAKSTSSLPNARSRVSRSASKIETTVAMDFGRITIDEELILYLFGTPGQRRFDFMWEILSEGMLGFVVMVDSTRPETFREARRILDTFRSYSPCPISWRPANRTWTMRGLPMICVSCCVSTPTSRWSRAWRRTRNPSKCPSRAPVCDPGAG